MKTIKVELKNSSYPVFVGKSIFSQLLYLIKAKNLNKNLFVAIDANVEKHFGKMIRDVFKPHESKKYFLPLNTSEELKSNSGLSLIYKALMSEKFGRDTLIIAVGGGVIGDLVGFAASTYMRGVQLIHVPTTLIACVDSSIGGKTAINFEYYKNIVGTFYQPEFVLCDINFLRTLPKAELISGFGEIVKYAFIADKSFLNFVNENYEAILLREEEVIERIITNSVRYKADVVSVDEKESGLRKVLNFGHTFAHAFEKELKHKIKHGEAVIAGIVCALVLSNKKKLLSKDKLQQYLNVALKIKLNGLLANVKVNSVYQHMLKDKKNRNGGVNFVLIREIGELILDVHASPKEVAETIYLMKKLLN
ncbi:MAG: 3-dehydroquinate synthase [Ignavibacteriaceae bacterium]|nr:3-dehydroquinate synthase [Ignavibacteriaceae bacterium]